MSPSNGADERRDMVPQPPDATHSADEEFERIVDGCVAAVADEIEAVRCALSARGLSEAISLTHGRQLDGSAGGFTYEWFIPAGPHDVRPDDAVRVRCRSGESFGFVVAFERPVGRVVLSTQSWLGQLPDTAELEFDPTWLLDALSDRLERIRAQPERFHPRTVLRLFGRSFPTLGSVEPVRPADLNASQRNALGRLLGSDVQFVWGPPGTGKTRLLAELAAELGERRKVLVTGVTNGAIDEAAARIAAALGPGAVMANRIVRVGSEFGAGTNRELWLDSAVERRVSAGAAGVADRVAAVEGELLPRHARRTARGPVRARVGRLLSQARAVGAEDALAELRHIEAELQRQAVFALRGADIVVSTLARLALWDDLAALRFHALILEEASTAPLPYVLLAAAMTSDKAFPIGDFQQLPAVVVAETAAADRWLKRDIFQEAGVVEREDDGGWRLPSADDRLCSMLVEQHRMAPPVRTLVSDLFYGGRLTDAPALLERPGPVAPVVLVDTSELRPVVIREGGSRENPAHAEVVASVVELAVGEGIDDIGVAVPYRLQARRIRALLNDRLGHRAAGRLEVRTIHRFQGREKSLMLFDTVDAPPGRSWFLNEARNADFPRLLNVALSRARDMLIIVGTPGGLRRCLPTGSVLLRLVERVSREGTVLSATDLRSAGWIFADRRL